MECLHARHADVFALLRDLTMHLLLHPVTVAIHLVDLEAALECFCDGLVWCDVINMLVLGVGLVAPRHGLRWCVTLSR